MWTGTPEALARGRGLFNGGRFFDAHEAWEHAWRLEDGESKLLLQGLIQVAAGCHKVSGNQPRGAVKLLASGLEKLARVPDGTAGLALEEFRASLRQALAGEAQGLALSLVLRSLDG